MSHARAQRSGEPDQVAQGYSVDPPSISSEGVASVASEGVASAASEDLGSVSDALVLEAEKSLLFLNNIYITPLLFFRHVSSEYSWLQDLNLDLKLCLLGTSLVPHAPDEKGVETAERLSDLERRFWLDQAGMQRPLLSAISRAWTCWNAAHMLYDYLCLSSDLGSHPRLIQMVKAETVYVPILVARLCVFVLSMLVHRSRYFTDLGSTYLTSQRTTAFGIYFTMAAEFTISVLCLDINSGIHCILVLILFNYVPVRIAYKTPFFVAILFTFYLSLWLRIIFLDEEEAATNIWMYRDKDQDPGDTIKSTLSIRVLSVIGTLTLYVSVQLLTAFQRESWLVTNHLATEIGTQQETLLTQQRKKNQDLLNSMLPPSVTEKLSTGDTVVESYVDVTILFCLIVDFDKIVTLFSADEIVKILNIVYSEFDKISDDEKVYKVETVGEVYMMSSGCPTRSVRHAENAADMALTMIETLPSIREKLKEDLQSKTFGTVDVDKKMEMFNNFTIQVGLNTGSVTAGVIGATCLRFKLFGDTVNTASRMESNSVPGFITVSESTFKLLVKSDEYVFKRREKMQMKGKGMMQTYFLIGNNNFKYSSDYDAQLSSQIPGADLSRRIIMMQKSLEEEKTEDTSHQDFLRILEMDDTGVLGNENPNDLEGLMENTRESLGMKVGSAFRTSVFRAISWDDSADKQFAWTRQRKMVQDLTNRELPQLSQSRTLLILLGHHFDFLKPEPSRDAFLEALYTHNLFISQRISLRRLLGVFALAYVISGLYDAILIDHLWLIIFVRYGPLCVALTGFFAFTYSSSFFKYQQTAVYVTLFIFGVSIVMYSTYASEFVGYGFVLIFLHFIFHIELLFFLSRVTIAFAIPFCYFVAANQFAVRYHVSTADSVVTYNLTSIGNLFCCENGPIEDCDTMWKDSSATEWSRDSSGRLDIQHIVENWGYKEISVNQTLAPKDIVYQCLIMFFYVILLTYPSWLSNYFARVCFNRFQEAERRKIELNKENKATARHLCKLLPPSVVKSFQNSRNYDFAETYDNVTILFVDMVGFTKFSSQLDPDELMLFLNHMYTKFDVILERFSLYKVEIVGDALFAVAGCPSELVDDFHAARAVCAAHGLLREIESIRNELDIDVQIRIGVHTGPTVAGVVGSKDPRYYLFGKTANVAEKIESTGLGGRVHCSKAVIDSIVESSSKGEMPFHEMMEFTPRYESNALEADSIREAENAVGSTFFANLKVPLEDFDKFPHYSMGQGDDFQTDGKLELLVQSARKTQASKMKTSRNKLSDRSSVSGDQDDTN